MTNRYLLPIFILLSLLLVTTTSCKKEKINDTDGGYPILLTTEQDGRTVKLSWTKVNNSNFENYIVVRSSEDIPDSPTPNAQSIATIDDYEANSFDDISPLLTDYIYYKVYAKVGDRFLMSQTVKTTSEIKLLDIFANDILFDKERELVYMFDPNKNKLFKYDCTQAILVDTLDLPGTFLVKMALGKYNGKNELYMSRNGVSTISIYDADNFEYLTNINGTGSIYSIAAGNNGLIYVNSDSWSNDFLVYDRETKQLSDANQSTMFVGESGMEVLTDDGLEVAIANFQLIGIFKISQHGLILEVNAVPTTGIFFDNVHKIAKSDDGQFIIPEPIGNIFNNKLEPVGTLSGASFQAFRDFVFSADNSKIWAASSSFNRIQTFSFPDLSEEPAISLDYSVNRMYRGKDALIVVGLVSDPFGNTRTIIDKLKIL